MMLFNLQIEIDSSARQIVPTMGVTMRNVLKFPLQSVRRSADINNQTFGEAEILFFTGVRYERHSTGNETLVESEKNIERKQLS